jgi:hypothetical protein
MIPQTGLPPGELLVVHALCLKQVATAAELVAMTALRTEAVEQHLAALDQAGEATLRARHHLWQLTPQGVARHAAWLAEEAGGGPGVQQVRRAYDDFLPLNVAFKEKCGKWQLREGQPNDHEDRAYDATVVEGLKEIDARAADLLATMSNALPRLRTYRPRLAEALARLQQGDADAFTGVLQGSYHDIWMELHQDLIVTLGVDRRAEGSV